MYIGIETGDDELLKRINKGETFNSTVDGILKANEAGIDTSIMIINGLGGKKYSETHALRSAEVINKINPKYLSTLTLSFPYGIDHFKKRFDDTYQQQTIIELFEELKVFIQNLNVENTIYRSDHVSNNLILKGILSKDQKQLIDTLDWAIQQIAENKYPSSPEFL